MEFNLNEFMESDSFKDEMEKLKKQEHLTERANWITQSEILEYQGYYNE